MKKLLLLRHAKSSWADPLLPDFDRPLNERGLSAAPFMGTVIAKEGLAPDLVISSTAERARQTAELAVRAGEFNTEIKYDERIYEATPGTLLGLVNGINDHISSVMIVGHNPASEAFIKLLTGRYEAMPTAALAVIDLNVGGWEDVMPGTGTLVDLIYPKDRLKSLGKAG